MARISTYDLDGTISNTDKVIGTDSSNTTTKNFKLQSLKEFIFAGISGPVTINSSGVSSVTFPDVTLGTDTSGSYVESLVAGDGIQLLNNSGEGATPTIKVNPLQTTITSILNDSLCVGRDSTNKICFTTDNQIRFTVNNALDLILAENALTPGASDGTALGTSSLMWSDLFLASLSVINFNNGNVTVTHGDGVLQIDTDSKLEFGDTGTFIHQSANGILDLVSDDELELNATNEVEINTTLVDVNASGAITLNAEANSNVTITGELDIDSSSALTIDSATSISIGNHQDKPVDIDASTLQIDASGGFSIDSGAVSSNITVTTGGGDAKDLTVSVTGGGDSSLILTSTGTGTDALDINSSGGIDIDSTGGFALNAGGNSNITVTGSLDVDASSNITIDGTGVSIDGTLDSNLTVTGSGQDLALKAIGGGAQVLSLDSAGTGTNAIDINATGGGVDIVAAANVSMLAATSFVAQGNTSATFGDDTEQIAYDGSGNLDIDAVTLDLESSGAINILAAGNASHITIKTEHVAGPSFHLDANSNIGSIVDIDAGILNISSDGLTSMLSASTFDIDAAGAVTIDGSAITIGADDSGVAISIGHTTSETTVNDNLNVKGTFKINVGTDPSHVITFPTARGNNNQVLKTDGSGNLSFTDPSAGVTVTDNDDDTDFPIVFHDESNNLLDDTNAFEYNPSTGLLTVNKLTPKTNAAGDIGSLTLAYNDLFLSNGGKIEFIQGTGNRSQITHIDGGVDGSGDRLDGSLRISSSTKLEFNDAEVFIASIDDGHLDLVADTEVQIVSPIVNIDASTRVDVSGALTVGGALTLPSQTAKHFFAAPTGSAGAPSFRVIAVADVPTLNQSTTGSAATLTTARNFSLTGNVTASAVSFDGSGNVALSTSLAANTVDSSELVDGSIDTSHIGDDQVTYAKIQNVANDERILGRVSGANGVIEELTKSQVLTMINVADGAQVNAVTSIVAGGGIDVSAATGAVTVTAEDSTASNKGAVIVAGGSAIGVTYSSGTATVNHDDTSSQASVNNSGDTFIQDLTFDTYGHVTGATSATASSNSSTFTVTANNSNNETVYPIFVDGATGSQGAETDTGLFYNPSTGKLTSESLSAKGGSSGTSSKGGVLNLSTKDTAVLENDILGTIEFQAPDEANGGDSQFVAAEIRAVAEESFTNTQNDSKFEFLMSKGTALTSTTSPIVTIASSGIVTGSNFAISSDKRLKSEIQPIKEGLEVIKQFTSYNYIKGGKKESGFIAQEVQEVIPHTVYEDKEGMLSMSDRGVVAHMHKAILELEKRLISIEEKLK